MSITKNAAQRAPATADAFRERPHSWTAILILLAILACIIAAWFYVDARPIIRDSGAKGEMTDTLVRSPRSAES